MTSSRELFFKNKVLKNFYRDDQESSNEDTKEESLSKKAASVKRKVDDKQELSQTREDDWPVPLPKLKKVYTVSVKPEDLQAACCGTNQGAQLEEGKESPSTQEQKISKNKKRKLKKKRKKEKEQQNSREFTY